MSNKRINHALFKKRLEAVIKKAEEGDVYSMRLMAAVYTEGEYFPIDNLAAEAWLRKAAELGSDEAKKGLAKLLTYSNGIAQDFEEAFDLYHELMMDCDLDGMVGVGRAYKEGRGIQKDEKKGSFFLQQAFDIELDLMNHEQKKE
jgi:uncharacterized protein